MKDVEPQVAAPPPDGKESIPPQQPGLFLPEEGTKEPLPNAGGERPTPKLPSSLSLSDSPFALAPVMPAPCD